MLETKLEYSFLFLIFSFPYTDPVRRVLFLSCVFFCEIRIFSWELWGCLMCLKENKSDTSSLIELIKIRIKYLEM